MKKVLAFCLTILMLVSLLVGCGGGSVTDSTRIKPTTTTKLELNNTTTTKSATTSKSATTTTTKPLDLERKDGVINEEITKKVSKYIVNDDFTVGKKQERQITYKGTILIGNTAATTGNFAGVGLPFNQGLQAYINAVNYDGGIGGDFDRGIKGYYIEFIHYDDGFTAELGSSYTKKLVEEDKVFALVGHFGSPTVGATINYIKQTGVVACYFASGVGTLFNTDADSVATGSTLFPVQPIYTTEGRIIVGRIIQQYPDTKKIGIIFTADEAGVGLKEGAVAQIQALGAGYEYVLSETTTVAADFTPAVTKVKDCDAIIIASIQKGVVGILKSMITNGVYKPVFTTHSVAASQTLQDIKSDYDKLSNVNKFPIYANAWLSSTDAESYFEFCADVISYAGNADETANSYAMAGWISATIFCEGLERVVAAGKQITNLTFVEAMESDDVMIKMGSSYNIDSMLDYSDGYRIGTTTMSLLKNNAMCNAFEEADSMRNFIDFIKSGDVSDIR